MKFRFKGPRSKSLSCWLPSPYLWWLWTLPEASHQPAAVTQIISRLKLTLSDKIKQNKLLEVIISILILNFTIHWINSHALNDNGWTCIFPDFQKKNKIMYVPKIVLEYQKQIGRKNVNRHEASKSAIFLTRSF